MTPVTEVTAPGPFTSEQKEYLESYLAAMAVHLPFVAHDASGRLSAAPGNGAANLAATPAEDTYFGTPVSDLAKPERWKRDENPLDIWTKLLAHAEEDKFPDEADTFRFKFHGLFYVAPAQDSFMLRLRIPAGVITSGQLRGLADLAAARGGGYSHITTRANLQIREFRPASICEVLTTVQELGLTSRGAGADNVRNITATPTTGFDPDELIDVRPFARGLHHYILNHRDLYGLPRKFNIAFDSAGAISAAADTNDLGFFAVRVSVASLDAAPGSEIAPGIYFRAQLGGISGHGDFARDTGLLLQPREVVAVAAAMIRVFNENADRTNRKKARLKYLLEKWGVEKFLEETQRKLAFPLRRLPLTACEARPPVRKHGWLGIHPQTDPALRYAGIALPAGRIETAQMRDLADLADEFGRGELRLTVWQNVLIPHIPAARIEAFRRAVTARGFSLEAAASVGGIIACTGNRGCKYAATDTKSHAVALGAALRERLPELNSPVNVHFTGCPHSCAQHYCGDIGLLGAKLADGTEGYHVVLGGGMDHEQGIARELFRNVPATDVPDLVERVLSRYLAHRKGDETFLLWVRRHPVDELRELCA